MRRQRSFVLSFLVAAMTIASAALAANTAIEPVSKADNAHWMARHQAINARAKQGHVDLIYVGDSIVEYYERQGKDTWDRYYAPLLGGKIENTKRASHTESFAARYNYALPIIHEQ